MLNKFLTIRRRIIRTSVFALVTSYIYVGNLQKLFVVIPFYCDETEELAFPHRKRDFFVALLTNVVREVSSINLTISEIKFF